jgi:hypothetical protein
MKILVNMVREGPACKEEEKVGGGWRCGWVEFPLDPRGYHQVDLSSHPSTVCHLCPEESEMMKREIM